MKKKTRIAIIATTFHAQIAQAMIAEAQKKIEELNARAASLIQVSGAYEVPLAAKRALKDPLIDAIVVLGYIEKGETLHGEVMGHVVHKTLMELQLEYEKPIGFGIIGPGATKEQAHIRITATARHAVEAACAMNEPPDQ